MILPARFLSHVCAQCSHMCTMPYPVHDTTGLWKKIIASFIQRARRLPICFNPSLSESPKSLPCVREETIHPQEMAAHLSRLISFCEESNLLFPRVYMICSRQACLDLKCDKQRHDTNAQLNQNLNSLVNRTAANLASNCRSSQ